MKECDMIYARVSLLKTQINYLKQSCDFALSIFNDEEKSCTIPYEFPVKEMDVLRIQTQLDYRNKSVEHTLADMLDEIRQLGKEVDYEER